MGRDIKHSSQSDLANWGDACSNGAVCSMIVAHHAIDGVTTIGMFYGDNSMIVAVCRR